MDRDALVALLHIYQTTSFDPPTVDINYIRTYLSSFSGGAPGE